MPSSRRKALEYPLTVFLPFVACLVLVLVRLTLLQCLLGFRASGTSSTRAGTERRAGLA